MAAHPTPESGSTPGRMPGPEGVQEPPRWWIYQGTGQPREFLDLAEVLPGPPPWRRFDGGPLQSEPPDGEAENTRILGPATRAAPRFRNHEEADAVNAALLLRRPLLVTGDPGIGKSSVAYRVARELKLGRVLRWPVNSRSELRTGLYKYDPIARIHDISADAADAAHGDSPEHHPIGDYLRLGPLGTALLPHRLPRVLLIDEFDKGDIDLANDLLDVLEAGQYAIPELERLSSTTPEVAVPTADDERSAVIRHGRVTCRAFPFIVITSNAEREFPAAFHRRCLRLNLTGPTEEQLADVVAAHFTDRARAEDRELIRQFLHRYQAVGGLSMDQLLNSVYLASSGRAGGGTSPTDEASWERVLSLVWQRLTEAGPQ